MKKIFEKTIIFISVLAAAARIPLAAKYMDFKILQYKYKIFAGLKYEIYICAFAAVIIFILAKRTAAKSVNVCANISGTKAEKIVRTAVGAAFMMDTIYVVYGIYMEYYAYKDYFVAKFPYIYITRAIFGTAASIWYLFFEDKKNYAGAVIGIAPALCMGIRVYEVFCDGSIAGNSPYKTGNILALCVCMLFLLSEVKSRYRDMLFEDVPEKNILENEYAMSAVYTFCALAICVPNIYISINMYVTNAESIVFGVVNVLIGIYSFIKFYNFRTIPATQE